MFAYILQRLSEAQSKRATMKGIAHPCSNHPLVQAAAGQSGRLFSETLATGPSMMLPICSEALPPPTPFLFVFFSVCEQSPFINWPDYKRPHGHLSRLLLTAPSVVSSNTESCLLICFSGAFSRSICL